MSSELLIIMARYPTRGKVKTRLAAEIGHTAATVLYRSFLKHFASEFARAPFDVEWRYTPARAPFRRLLCLFCGSALPGAMAGNRSRPEGRSHNYFCVPQPAGNLGQRMRQIFEESFSRGYDRVVMIGSDAPEVGQQTVRRALRLLHGQQAVFQPTFDGGYALIGLAAPLDVFSKISWSTDRVMAQTRRRLRKLRATFTELPPTFDVDTAEDLKRLVTAPARRGCSSSGR